MMRVRSIACCFFLAASLAGLSQNLDKLGNKGGRVKVSGGVRLNTMSYFAQGIAQRRDPFTWTLNGNINVNILDVALPFTFTYSNLGTSYTQPFNMTALHPKYKWAQAHVGLTSMSFSPYTLAGRTFLGGGLDLTPGKWKISLMGGRLTKPVEYSPDNPVQSIAYRRWGGGLKVGYEHKGYGFEFIAFKAADDPESIQPFSVETSVTPQDNLVIGLKGKATPFSGFSITGEYALSVLTRNRLTADKNTIQAAAPFQFAMDCNATTSLYHAVNGSVGYNWKWVGIQAKYERLQPGYATLGGFFFNNDLENYTLSPAFKLFKGKLNLAINSGFQRNDLDGSKSSKTKRWVGSVNISSTPINGLTLTANYSNFSTYTRNRPSSDPFYFQPADTMNFYQVNQNATASMAYQFGTKKFRSVVQLMSAYQESENITGNIQDAGAFGFNLSSTGQQTRIYLGNLGYSANWISYQMSLSISGNFNHSRMAQGHTSFVGPSLSWQKGLFKKTANITVGTTYNLQYQDESQVGNVLNYRLGFNYNPKWWDRKFGKLGFGLNANWLQRLLLDKQSGQVNEVNVFVNVNYTIG